MVGKGDDFMFYHDALSIMTAKECREYMEEKGVLKHWILPELGLNDTFARFKGVPLGNSPELMPLDASLNKDVDDGVNVQRPRAAQFVETVEQRQGLKIACLEEIALRMGFIDPSAFEKLAASQSDNHYGRYLARIAREFAENL